MRGERISSVLLVIILLVGVLFSATTFVARGESEKWIPGLVEDYVYVYRDNWGVPHIYASSVSDAYFALGYVMAEDRLFQMDLFRRSVAGRLAEIFGPDAFEQDVVMRTLGVYQIAIDTWNDMYPSTIIPSDIKKNLEQFSAGVNQYIADMKIPDDMPTEYWALSISTGIPITYFIPYPWTPPDSIAIAGMMGLMLTDTSAEEIIKGAYTSMVDPIFAAQGLPGMSDFLMPITWTNATTISFPDPPITKIDKIEPITAPLHKIFGSNGFGLGSNNWVISGLNTTTGNTMLANDPHLDLQTPGINWQVHINVPGWANVIGCCIPGGPVIYTGHNDYFAFGVTNLMADIMDLYYYVANETHYWYVDHWEPFIVTPVVIYNFTQPVTIPVVSTIHGPLVTTPLPPPFDKMAVRWAGKEAGYGDVIGFTLMMNATSLAEWKQALSYQSVIIQNYVYAGKDGNIAWCPSGKIPLRPPPPPAGTGTLGVAPSNGSAAQNEWMGWLPHSTAPIDYPFDPWPGPVSLPYIENPSKGFIATANNQPIGPGYFGYPWPIWIGPAFGYAPGYRAQRITELIKSLSPIDIEDMKTIQTDSVCIPARNMVPILLGVMAGDSNATVQNALAILAAWNYSELRNLAAPLIWEVFLQIFAYNTFYDEFGPYGLYPFPNMIIPLWNMTQTWMWNPYAITLFDNKFTPSAGPGQPGWEFMPEIMNKSLRDTLDWIASQLGPPADPAFSNWKYGDLHVVNFDHPMGSALPGLNVPVHPVGCDGGPFTVDPAGFGLITPDEKELLFVESGASYRGIYECKDGWDTSLILVPPGESGRAVGHPLSVIFDPHYRDTFELWLNDEYTTCLFDDTVIQTYSKTIFYPAVHNIAIKSVVPSSTRVAAGTVLDIDVTVKNEGIYAETFDVSLYYDGNLIGTQTVSGLAPKTTTVLSFQWDTSGVTPCHEYNITAVADIVPEEIHTMDNTLSAEEKVKIGPSAPTIKVEPSIVQMQVFNKTFDVNITINDLAECWQAVGFEFRLKFNATLLEVVSVSKGAFIEDPRWNLHGTFLTYRIEDQMVLPNGTIVPIPPELLVGLVLLPGGNGVWEQFPYGSGTLVTVTFRIIYQEESLDPDTEPPLTCDLTIYRSSIVDPEGAKIPHSIENGLYEIYARHLCDVNWDYYVGIDDITYAAEHFGSDPETWPERWDPECDVTGDNYVGIDDIVLIASNFGWTPTYDP
jgi:penicillin amidase